MLSSFVFDVTLISVGRILTADQIVCAQANDWLRCLEYTTFLGTVISNSFARRLMIGWAVSSGKQTVIKSR